MTSREVLSPEAVRRELEGLDGWTVEDGKLHREYAFTDFVAAFGFMASAALCAERRNHHPAWHNVYNRVVVDLWTHDAGGITMFDVELARDFERIAAGG